MPLIRRPTKSLVHTQPLVSLLRETETKKLDWKARWLEIGPDEVVADVPSNPAFTLLHAPSIPAKPVSHPSVRSMQVASLFKPGLFLGSLTLAFAAHAEIRQFSSSVDCHQQQQAEYKRYKAEYGECIATDRSPCFDRKTSYTRLYYQFQQRSRQLDEWRTFCNAMAENERKLAHEDWEKREQVAKENQREKDEQSKRNKDFGWGLAGGVGSTAGEAVMATQPSLPGTKPKSIVIPNPPGRTPVNAVPVIIPHESGPTSKEIAATSMGTAALGMIWDTLTAPKDESAVSSVERATIPMNNILREGAMPGESGAAARVVQNLALPVLRAQQRMVEGQLEEWENMMASDPVAGDSSGSSASSSGSTFRGTPIRSFDGGSDVSSTNDRDLNGTEVALNNHGVYRQAAPAGGGHIDADASTSRSGQHTGADSYRGPSFWGDGARRGAEPTTPTIPPSGDRGADAMQGTASGQPADHQTHSGPSFWKRIPESTPESASQAGWKLLPGSSQRSDNTEWKAIPEASGNSTQEGRTDQRQAESSPGDRIASAAPTQPGANAPSAAIPAAPMQAVVSAEMLAVCARIDRWKISYRYQWIDEKGHTCHANEFDTGRAAACCPTVAQ